MMWFVLESCRQAGRLTGACFAFHEEIIRYSIRAIDIHLEEYCKDE